jgi:hypothetical protein
MAGVAWGDALCVCARVRAKKLACDVQVAEARFVQVCWGCRCVGGGSLGRWKED